MNQRTKHTETSPNSYDAAAYGYDYRHDGFGGSAQASQSAAWSRTLTEHSSSLWITDGSGNACTERSRSVNQHLQYLPFGEQFIDQRTNHDIRFKFTNKEEDSETGYQYFGARYYASDLSIWLSVDPLSDMYPSTSPFMYTMGNPVMYIDTWGMNANPIFDESGELLGTDSEGWKGEAIVMKKDDFKQGMEHSEAENKGTYLSKYGKGIKIADESWDKVEENGGERMNPYVWNNSNKTVYYKPEGEIDDIDQNPRYDKNGAYPIAPYTDLYARVDGVATKKESKMIYKINDGGHLKVDANGDVSAYFSIWRPDQMAIYYLRAGWKDENWLKERHEKNDTGWDKLFLKAKKY